MVNGTGSELANARRVDTRWWCRNTYPLTHADRHPRCRPEKTLFDRSSLQNNVQALSRKKKNCSGRKDVFAQAVKTRVQERKRGLLLAASSILDITLAPTIISGSCCLFYDTCAALQQAPSKFIQLQTTEPLGPISPMAQLRRQVNE